ncbi:methylenetetrahydrofolate reductase [NAD(P)H] [Nocardioides donggukensis]|uniref:Methylenetetrahydrofolate reductase n=1 Tax=Nocardioides donggukensis TaxID=2774019 RepID=A0A927K3M3_9ACTN|nr:methylenetetrahydrofolate reductase [NAD(P)H] [Nocardioides donggukensis]MBD8869196.1 methylenetetrahydrofolate reductase [NAD(P)H] [Nocardioides donggukensis]
MDHTDRRGTQRGTERGIGRLIREGERSFSFEFMPPKDPAGEEQLWQAIRELEPYRPTFVSVTYGAGGSTRDTTARITGRIARETSLVPMAHLTCVGHTRAELEGILDSYAAAGIGNVLALRGDPQDGPRADWLPTPGGFTYACELVELAAGRFSVGVAAFSEGHPAAESLESDVRVLLDKQRAGAEFAITDMVFRSSDYLGLVERAGRAGVEIPILPGIMPILNLGQVRRMAELSGRDVPPDVVARVAAHEGDPAAVRAEGIAMAAELCEALLDGGAPGLHFYTLNRSRATREIFAALRISA